MDILNLGALLRQARMRARLTQDELGKRLDPPVHQSTIHMWESGKWIPRIGTIDQLAKSLNTTVIALLGVSRDEVVTTLLEMEMQARCCEYGGPDTND